MIELHLMHEDLIYGMSCIIQKGAVWAYLMMSRYRHGYRCGGATAYKGGVGRQKEVIEGFGRLMMTTARYD